MCQRQREILGSDATSPISVTHPDLLPTASTTMATRSSKKASAASQVESNLMRQVNAATKADNAEIDALRKADLEMREFSIDGLSFKSN